MLEKECPSTTDTDSDKQRHSLERRLQTGTWTSSSAAPFLLSGPRFSVNPLSTSVLPESAASSSTPPHLLSVQRLSVDPSLFAALPKRTRSPDDSKPLTPQKAQNRNRYGLKGTLKCSRCRMQSHRCVFDDPGEVCKHCAKAGFSACEKLSPAQYRSTAELSRSETYQSLVRDLKTTHQQVEWVKDFGSPSSTNDSADLSQPVPPPELSENSHHDVNSLADSITKVLSKHLPGVDPKHLRPVAISQAEELAEKLSKLVEEERQRGNSPINNSSGVTELSDTTGTVSLAPGNPEGQHLSSASSERADGPPHLDGRELRRRALEEELPKLPHSQNCQCPDCEVTRSLRNYDQSLNRVRFRRREDESEHSNLDPMESHLHPRYQSFPPSSSLPRREGHENESPEAAEFLFESFFRVSRPNSRSPNFGTEDEVI